MNKEIKKVKDLKDGDIFYFNFQDTNEYETVEVEDILYGNDVVGIVDDSCEAYNGVIYINHFGMIEFKNNKIEVLVIGHYSELITN